MACEPKLWDTPYANPALSLRREEESLDEDPKLATRSLHYQGASLNPKVDKSPLFQNLSHGLQLPTQRSPWRPNPGCELLLCDSHAGLLAVTPLPAMLLLIPLVHWSNFSSLSPHARSVTLNRAKHCGDTKQPYDDTLEKTKCMDARGPAQARSVKRNSLGLPSSLMELSPHKLVSAMGCSTSNLESTVMPKADLPHSGYHRHWTKQVASQVTSQAQFHCQQIPA